MNQHADHSASTAAASPGFSSVRVVSKEIRLQARNSIARVMKVDEVEGMLATHLSELLNISESYLRKQIRKHAIGAQPMDAHRMRSELGTNVIPIFARSLLFIPKAGIKQLVRVINTPEAYAIYLELWEYAEGFAELEAERDQMKADLAAIRTELKRVNDERESLLSERDELAAAAESLARGFEELSALHRELTANSQHTQAKLNAAIHFIEHKPGPRACRYRIAEIEFVGVNIFEGPQFRLATRKLKLEEMNPEQRNVHAIQKGSISAQGTIKSTRRRLQAMGTSNADLLSKVQNWERAGEDFLNTLMPTTMEFSGFAN